MSKLEQPNQENSTSVNYNKNFSLKKVNQFIKFFFKKVNKIYLFLLGVLAVSVWWVNYGSRGTADLVKANIQPGLVVLQQDLNKYQGVTDTKLDSSKPKRNYGSTGTLTVQADSWIGSLIKFDLSDIPLNALIEEAKLELFLVSTNDSGSFTLKIYKMLRPWLENEANWTKATKNVVWGSEGANKIGVDREGIPLSQGRVSSVKTWYQFDLTSAVQEWVIYPNKNFGVLLRGDDSSAIEFRFASANYSDKSLRPRLVIKWSGQTLIPTFTPIPTLTTLPTVTSTVPSISPTSYFSPTPSPLPSPSPYPTDVGIRPEFNNVKTWVYQLSSYQPNNTLDQIKRNNFDLVVVDLARDGMSNYFTNQEITSLKNSGKIVLAYFEIGALENYRPEWNIVNSQAPDLLLGSVSGWPDERYVKYWDEQWWNLVVKNRVDQALRAGFDGAYMDMIVTYEEIAANAAGTNREDLARKMVDLIARVSQYAKSINPNFKMAIFKLGKFS